jgi:hypothetical protein
MQKLRLKRLTGFGSFRLAVNDMDRGLQLPGIIGDPPDQLLISSIMWVRFTAEDDLQPSDVARSPRLIAVLEYQVRSLLSRRPPREADRHYVRIHYVRIASPHRPIELSCMPGGLRGSPQWRTPTAYLRVRLSSLHSGRCRS